MTLAAVLCCAMTVWGQTISEQEAKERALQFLSGKTSAQNRVRSFSRQSQLKTANLDIDGLYAFNCEGGGFVIASGDDRTVPILGYSDEGSIDLQQMPENMKAWLGYYGAAINVLGTEELRRGEQPSSSRQAISPLLTSRWYQDEPYNNECPKIGNENAITGCVATAMAQVMYYHRWPQEACEKIPTYTFYHKNGDITLDELPQMTFDWDNMIDDYSGDYTDEQATAVARLMRYCGQSVSMQYGSKESGSDGTFVSQAARHFFGYDQGVTSIVRSMYGIEEWEQMIYDELAAKRPVVYCGQASTGHCYVCDGYDGNGLFHINWGWGGDDDGYFSLSVLNPFNNDSTGAISSQMGYNFSQQAIIGMQRPTGTTAPSDESPKLVMYEDMCIREDTVKINAVYENLFLEKEVFEVALGTIGNDGELTPCIMAEESHEIERPFDADFDIVVNNQKLSNGTYQLVPMARCVSTDGNWHLMQTAEKKIQVEVSDNGVTYKLTYLPDLSIEKCYISKGTGIISEDNEITMVVKNKGNEYSGNLRLRSVFLGDKTPEEVLKNLPPVSELEPGKKLGGFFKKESTDSLQFVYSSNKKGNYLFLLYEDRNDILLATTTLEFDKDYEFELVDLEVVAYKFYYCPNSHIEYSLTIKNNDVINNWPKYYNRNDSINISYNSHGHGPGGSYPIEDMNIPKGEQKSTVNDIEGIMTDYPVFISITEDLCDGRSKLLLELTIQSGETIEYPHPTGVSSIAASKDDSKVFYNLNGQRFNGQPAKGGIYIQKGKKISIN